MLDSFTPRRLRGGVRARSGRGGWRRFYDWRRFATPQKFANANFYPPPQAAEGEIFGEVRFSAKAEMEILPF